MLGCMKPFRDTSLHPERQLTISKTNTKQTLLKNDATTRLTMCQWKKARHTNTKVEKKRCEKQIDDVPIKKRFAMYLERNFSIRQYCTEWNQNVKKISRLSRNFEDDDASSAKVVPFNTGSLFREKTRKSPIRWGYREFSIIHGKSRSRILFLAFSWFFTKILGSTPGIFRILAQISEKSRRICKKSNSLQVPWI